MSNYIYNGDFSDPSGDREPINFSFGFREQKKSLSTKTAIIIMTVGIILSLIIGAFGGVLASKYFTEKNTPPVYHNDVYVSPDIRKSSASTSDLQSAGISRADVVDAIKDSVVEIQTQYRKAHYQYVQSGAGSGVIIGKYKTDDGQKGYYVATNAHVVQGESSSEIASKIIVTLTDGTEYQATVKGFDPLGDLAVLMIPEAERELTCASFANDNSVVRVGDEVIVIGNPLGKLGGTVTNGYISALEREIEIDGNKMVLMQTDAAINPGNSGGGLFNLNGELIGIVNAKSSGTGIEGLGFAIPYNEAYKVCTDLINYGYVTNRPTIMAKYMTYRYSSGTYVYVYSVDKSEDGHDNSAQLKFGDIIYGVRINGKDTAINSSSALDSVINNQEVGSTIILLINRNGKNVAVEVEIFKQSN